MCIYLLSFDSNQTSGLAIADHFAQFVQTTYSDPTLPVLSYMPYAIFIYIYIYLFSHSLKGKQIERM